MSERIRIREVTVLSDDWYLLKKTTFDFHRSNGRWQTLSRETYDRGNGAVILLVNSEKQTLILTSQFRYPAFVNGLTDGMLLEACAGLLDSEDPEETIRREVEEETGFRIGPPRKLFGEILDAKTMILLQRLAVMCGKSPNLSAASNGRINV